MNEVATIVISAIAGGTVTYVFERVNEKRKNKNDNKKAIIDQRKNRPEFSIIEMTDHFDNPGEAITNKTNDLEVYSVKIEDVYFNDKDDFFVKLDNKILNKEDLVCREYKMKNIGKTAVYEVDLISNSHKTICLLENVDVTYDLIKHGVLNYHVLYDRRVGPDEFLTMKLIFHKDLILSGLFSASYSIGMRDDNGNYWIQPFFAPEDKLYETRICTFKEYKKMISIDVALKCFKNPHLW